MLVQLVKLNDSGCKLNSKALWR